MQLSAADRKRISDSIRGVEAKTSGEIICVLAQTSSDNTALPVLLAAIIALATPWLFVEITAMTVQRILLLQIITFAVFLVVLCLPKVRVALMPRAARRSMAHRVAMEQFKARGISRKKDRCGILIFVSMTERYARIIADDGIASRVPQSEWQSAVNALIAHVKAGDVVSGFVAAIEICGKELAAHFPRSDAATGHELPDRIYLI
jgi:putative membrane protein